MISHVCRKRYYASQKSQKGLHRSKEPFKVSVMSSLLSLFPDAKNGEEETLYLMGWTIVPPNMMSGLQHFMPVDAQDCAAMRGTANGILLGRATKDANDHIHPISLSCMIGAEGNFTLDAMHRAEKMILGDHSPLSAPGRLSIIDGGAALASQQLSHFPESKLWRCSRHLKEDLSRMGKKAGDEKELYEQLLRCTATRKEEALDIWRKMDDRSPVKHAPIEQVCPAFAHSPHHGNMTNNMVEVMWTMFQGVRTKVCDDALFHSKQHRPGRQHTRW